MELREFVAESLKQVIDGIAIAQVYAKEKGAQVSPATFYQNGNLVVGSPLGTGQSPDIIEFDVLVTISESGELKGGIGVFAGAVGLGANSKISDGNIQANRIKFSVPVSFPRQP